MNPSRRHTNRVPTLFQRPSGVFNPPMGVSPAQSAHSVSPDPAAMSQDSPARIDSFTTTLFGSSDTSVITVPPAAPQQLSPLQLRCNSDMRSIWPPQVSRVLQGLPLAHVDSIAETEVLSRGSCSKNEEEARVEELLAGPASLSADLAELAAPPAPREMKESATEEEPHGLNSNPVNIDSTSGGRRTSFAQRNFFAEVAVGTTSPTAAARVEKLRRGKGPLSACPNTSLSLQDAALRPMALEERSAAASGFHSVVTLDVTKMPLSLSPTRGEPSTCTPTVPRTSMGASRQSTADTAHVKLLPEPRSPQHTQLPPRFCVSSCSWDATTTSTQSSRAAFGAKRLPPLATFNGVHPSVRTSTADISLQDSRQVGTAPQARYRESADNGASSPVAVHADEESSRLMSPNISNPRAGATNMGEPSAVQSLPHASRFDSSGFFPSIALSSASVALLSSQEEVRPSPSLHTPPTDRYSRRNTPPRSPRPSFITRTSSTALSTSASPHYPTSLTPLQLPTSTPAAQHFQAAATRALRNRQHGVRSPLEAIWLRSEGLLAPSESMLSSGGCNKVDSPILNAASPPPAVAARNADALLGSSSRRQSQLNVHELSSSMLSHEISTVSSGSGVVPGNVMSPAGPQPVRERERRSMMQRIFREPKKGVQRVWVSITALDSRSPSDDASEKS